VGQIERRRFLAAAGATLAAPLLRAQSTTPVPRVGCVLTTAPLETMQGEKPAQQVMRGFLYGMRELGYVEGRDMVIERRSAEGHPERLPGLLRELVDARVDVVVVTGTIMVQYAMEATSGVPIVAAGMGEPQALRYAKSYAAPEGNLTGVVVISGAVGGKRLQLVKETLPQATRIAVLTQRRDWEIGGKDFLAEGSAIGLELEPVEVHMPDMDAALNSLAARRVDALLVSSAPPFFVHAKRIVDAAAKIKLPDFHYHSVAVEEGGLISYGHDAFEIFRRTARYVVALFKGKTTRELPIDRMENYSLVLNLRTAERLGIAIPPSIRLRADRVIE
jgi:putative ABC transport system substrate-binding protein